ncbi:autoinducer binding domain-containing protein [Burkholderia gladioli]|uniref:autoinducer binding domain-containing protein n=1 Tax=Burkholderia gladioli TaxID=28095 RepID=UPI001641BB01|nr:autoinducer binding domain-containing protein [Burkholderia gladioli]
MAENTFRIGADSFTYRLREQDGGTLVERDMLMSGAGGSEFRVTQAICAGGAPLLDFLRADPHAAAIEHVVGPRIADIALDMSEQADAAAAPSVPDALAAIGEIAYLPDEARLATQAWRIIQALKASTAFYFLVDTDDEGEIRAYRIIILSPAFGKAMQTYVHRRWYSTDPFLIHARKTQRVCFSSDVGLIENLGGSWREMAEFARENGMKSWLAAPAHEPRSRRFGVLYVANDTLPSQEGEAPLRRNVALFRTLSREIFEWYESRARSDKIIELGLSSQELRVLSGLSRQFPLELIADTLEIGNTVLRDRLLPAIRAKFSVSRIGEAVREAEKHNLLMAIGERKVAYIVYSETYGIFLREEYGAQFWSQLNPSGIDRAQIFKDPEAARHYFQPRGGSAAYAMRRVDVHHTASVATRQECLAAGLPGWEPGHLSSEGPSDDSGTWGALDASHLNRQ